MIYTQKGLDWALNFIDSINADPSKYVIYKQSRPIANLKHMMVTTTDLYPNNTAFMMKFPGTKEYESISFTRVLEEMNALGTALIAKGLKGKRIAVCGENCYYWCLSYLAAVCGVGVVVPLDKELPDGDLKGLATAAYDRCEMVQRFAVNLIRDNSTPELAVPLVDLWTDATTSARVRSDAEMSIEYFPGDVLLKAYDKVMSQRQLVNRDSLDRRYVKRMEKYGDCMKMCERMPDVLSGAMGNQMYTAVLDTIEEVEAYNGFIHARAE